MRPLLHPINWRSGPSNHGNKDDTAEDAIRRLLGRMRTYDGHLKAIVSVWPRLALSLYLPSFV